MTKPFVSVIIPTYNSEKYLIETLESLRSQIYTNWEVIISDDCSNDSTVSLAQKFSNKVPQPVIILQNKYNVGLAENRNKAIKEANSSWIALLDSDDIWMPTHLNDCINAATSSNAKFIHSGSIEFDSNTGTTIRTIAPLKKAAQNLPISLFDRSYRIQPSSIMFQLEIFKSAGKFDKSFRCVEDLDFYLRCVRAGCIIKYTGKDTCRYRNHQYSLSKNHYKMAEAVARAYEKHIDWSELPKQYRLKICAYSWCNVGRLLWRKNPEKAIKYFEYSCRIRFQTKGFLLAIICRLRLHFKNSRHTSYISRCKASLNKRFIKTKNHDSQ